MNDDEIFAAIADERRTLADQVSTLTDEQWATPSLCAGWTCRDVLAHLVVPLVVSIPAFGWAMIKARGNFDRANLITTADVAKRHNDLPKILRDKANKRFTPPGYGPAAPLTDIVIHGLDIRRPLGLSAGFAPDIARVVLDFVTDKGGAPIVKRARVRWSATDLDWSHGDGPTVEGPAESLMLVLSGRDAGLPELRGDGVAHLG